MPSKTDDVEKYIRRSLECAVGYWFGQNGPVCHQSPDAIVEFSYLNYFDYPPIGQKDRNGKLCKTLPEYYLPTLKTSKMGRPVFPYKKGKKTEKYYEITGSELSSILKSIISDTHKDANRGQKGIALSNLRVTGVFDLSRLDLPFSLRFRHCYFDAIEARYTKFRTLDLSNCIVGAFSSTFAHYRGNVRIVASTFYGPVDFGGLTADRVFDLRRTYILPSEENYKGTSISGKSHGYLPFIHDRNVLNFSLGNFAMDVRLTEMVVVGGISMTECNVGGSIFLNRSKIVSAYEALRNLCKSHAPPPLHAAPGDPDLDEVNRLITFRTPHDALMKALQREKPPEGSAKEKHKSKQSELKEYQNAFIKEFLHAAEAISVKYILKGRPQLDGLLHWCSTQRKEHESYFDAGTIGELKRSAISALRGQELFVAKNIYMRDSRFLGAIRVRGLDVGGTINASRLDLLGPAENLRLNREPTQSDAVTIATQSRDLLQIPIPAFYAPFAKIGGEFDLSAARVVGAIHLGKARIGGDFDLVSMDWRPVRSILSKQTDPCPKDKMANRARRNILLARDIAVGGDLRFARFSTNQPPMDRTENTLPDLEASWAIHEQHDEYPKRGYVIDIIGAKITGDLILTLDYSRNPDFLTFEQTDWVNFVDGCKAQYRRFQPDTKNKKRHQARFDFSERSCFPRRKDDQKLETLNRWDVRLQFQSISIGRRLAIRGRWKQVGLKDVCKAVSSAQEALIAATGIQVHLWLPKRWTTNDSGCNSSGIPSRPDQSQRLLIGENDVVGAIGRNDPDENGPEDPFLLESPWPCKTFALKEKFIWEEGSEHPEETYIYIEKAPRNSVNLVDAKVSEFEFERSVWPQNGWLEIAGLQYSQLGRYGPLHFPTYLSAGREKNAPATAFIRNLPPLAVVIVLYVTQSFLKNPAYFAVTGLTVFSLYWFIFLSSKGFWNFLRGTQSHPRILHFLNLQADLRRVSPNSYFKNQARAHFPGGKTLKGWWLSQWGPLKWQRPISRLLLRGYWHPKVNRQEKIPTHEKSIPTQPYTVAARALRNQGFQYAARKVIMARASVANRGTKPLFRSIRSVLGVIFGHGYDLSRVFGILMAIFIIDWAITTYLLENKYVFETTPTPFDYSLSLNGTSANNCIPGDEIKGCNFDIAKSMAFEPEASNNRCATGADHSYRLFLYSIEHILPLLEGIESGCKLTENKNASSQTAHQTFEIPDAGYPLLYAWHLTSPILGWIMVTVLLAGTAARLQATLAMPEY